MFNISSEEKNVQFIYLLVFWLIIGIVFYFACFHFYELPEIRSKSLLTSELKKEMKIQQEQEAYSKHVDSLSKMIQHYDPGTSQVYLESSINYELEELQKLHDSQKDDPNFKIFKQLNTFYAMQFFDKKAVWTSKSNSESLRKNLEECEIGFQQKLNNLHLKEALKSK